MRKSAQTGSKSLRMFFIYGGIVLFFIFASLLIKTVFIIQQSRFDGEHQFILNLYQDNSIKEIIKFSPQENKIFVVSGIGNNIDIIPDAKVIYKFDLPLGTDVAQTMRIICLNYNSISTNLTVYDILRLIVLSYKTPVEVVDSISTISFFLDESILAENATIEIVNASGISGEGKKLEDTLSNLGFNIISVTTSRNEEKLSKVQYSGEETYTSKKLKTLLGFNLEKTNKAVIADITITIGQDNNRNNLINK